MMIYWPIATQRMPKEHWAITLTMGFPIHFAKCSKSTHMVIGGTAGTAEQAIDMRIFANESYTQGAVKKFCLESW